MIHPHDKTRPLYVVRDGLATLGPEALTIIDLLERRFIAWAAECGAMALSFPPLMRVEDLHRFDYFKNFPHLGLGVSPVRAESCGRLAELGELRALPTEHLNGASYMLPSAACYNVYLHLQERELGAAQYVTTVARCFRNEERYDDLRRLWGFTMREIVCVGEREAVENHISIFRSKVADWCAQLGLEIALERASDPFFDSKSSVALLQRAFPTKEEFVFRGHLSIGSVNFHRNFFGERCSIRIAGGAHAFTGCVAFGLERILFALLEAHGQDPSKVVNVLKAADAQG